MPAGWITYRKGTREYPVELFTEEMELTYEDGHTYRTQWWQTYTSVTWYRERVYTIVLRDLETGRQAEIITNLDRVYPEHGEPRWIIQAVKGRWRQENMFKWGQERCGLNRLWVWSEIEPLDDAEAQRPNPAYESLKRRLRKVEAQLAKYADVAPLRESISDGPWHMYIGERKARRLARWEALMREKAQIEEEMSRTAATISYQKLKGDTYEMPRLARAHVILGERILAYHVWLQLRELGRHFFADYRELSKFIDALLRAPGLIETTPTQIRVKLQPPHQPVYRRAAEQMLAALNDWGIQAPDGSGRTVKLSLEELPFASRVLQSSS